jgi:hypothetical protein
MGGIGKILTYTIVFNIYKSAKIIISCATAFFYASASFSADYCL